MTAVHDAEMVQHDTITLVPLPVPDELATSEATDVTLLGEAVETVDVGPFAGCYFRVVAVDLVVAVDQARRLLDEIERVVLDARQDRADAERHRCYCDLPLEVDELTCGASRCQREWALDRQGLIP
jgi:hypothetical protein